MKKFTISILLTFLCVVLFSTPLTGKIIVIDPGHGGPEDRGAVTENGLEEAVINLKVALYLRDMLEEEGAIVVLTRATDVAVSLKDRVDIANRIGADLFVCIHHNYMGTNRKADFSIVYFPSKSMDYSINMARILAEEFEEYVGTKPGDIGPGDVYVMRNLKVPGILGEPCLMSNPSREEWLRDDENLKKEARAYRNAILRLFSLDIPVLSDPPDEISERFEISSSAPLRDVKAYFEAFPLNVKLSSNGTKIDITVPDDVPPGSHELYVYGVSKNGVYTRSVRKKVVYSPKPDRIDVAIFPSRAPALPGSYYVVEYEIFHGKHKLDVKPIAEINKGFFTLKDGKILIPYMGYQEIELKIASGDIEKKFHLVFEGDKPVRVLILKDSSGKILKTVDYSGGKLEIRVEGYKSFVYESELNSPVSFDEVVLEKTPEGKVRGKTIGIAFDPDLENLAENLAKELESLGAHVLEKAVSNMRDEFRCARSFNKNADFAVLISLENSKLEKMLNVPFIIVEGGSPEDVLEKILKVLE